MIVDDQLIDKLATLSKLEFDVVSKQEIKSDLNKILNFMEKLNELDTEGIEPLMYINEDVNYIKVPKFVTGTKY